jgi:hypothetical protein
MLEFAFSGLQSVRNLAQGPRLRQLAKQHRHKLIPTTRTLGPMFELSSHVAGKIRELKKSENLAK